MEFSWKEQEFDFTKIQEAQQELAKLDVQIQETNSTIQALQTETQTHTDRLDKFVEAVKTKEQELILLNAQLSTTKKELSDTEARLAYIHTEVEKHQPVLVKIAEDRITSEKLEEEIKHKKHTLKVQTKQEDELFKRIAELEQKLKPRQGELDELNGKIMQNTKLLKTITWEREQNESVKNEIEQKLAILQMDQRNLSQYIRPIQNKLDKAGIKLDFIKFIQDI